MPNLGIIVSQLLTTPTALRVEYQAWAAGGPVEGLGGDVELDMTASSAQIEASIIADAKSMYEARGTVFASSDKLRVFGPDKSDIVSGTYTPTVVMQYNVFQVSITPNSWQFQRIGNIVRVSGRMILKSTVAGDPSIIRLSLPINSTFTALEDLAGGGNSFALFPDETIKALFCSANYPNPEVTIYWVQQPTDSGNWQGQVSFMYIVR